MIRLPLFTLLAMGPSGCADRIACTTQILTVAPSPAAELKAVVFARSCSPRDITMNLSVLPRADELEDGSGNILVLTMDPARGTTDFPRVTWRDTSRLDVLLDPSLIVRHSVTEAATVRVNYLTPSGDPFPGTNP